MRGQATVEAAFSLPVLFVLMMVLMQPGIILYDRMVMESAAAEACRMLATAGPGSGMGSERMVELVKRHLSAVPEHDLFHVHRGSCSWDIQLEGGEDSSQVRVRISNRLKPLPLIGVALHLMGVSDSQGTIGIEVERSSQTQPGWVVASGISPTEWVGQRR